MHGQRGGNFTDSLQLREKEGGPAPVLPDIRFHRAF
jgi:hypothetical protein